MVNRLTDSQVGRRQAGRKVHIPRNKKETSRHVKSNIQAAQELSRETGEQVKVQVAILAV